MKKLSLVFSLVIFAVSFTLAQRTVVGSLTDQDGEALIGASVLVKGTNSGTVTDIDGKYSVDVPSGATTLVYSYTGYETQEIELGASNVVNITMAEGITLETAVVTALGIERDKKSLGYATQKVDGDAVSTAKTDNFVNSLSGKLAGVQIKPNNNFGGSTDIIVRGHTSLTGNNQALFVVDGVPIENSVGNTTDQQRGQRGYDYGNAASDINPEDIESINVLKGAAATALYGSRAANGAVIITTKKAEKRKGIGVTFSTGFTLGQIDRSTFAEYQDEYGAGYGPYYDSDDGYFFLHDVDGDGTDDEVVATSEDGSFGAAFDPNRMVYHWDAFVPESENFGKKRPWVAAENTPAEFFETARTYNNSVAISGATDKGNFRLSYTNYNTTGVMPNSELKKNTISFNSGYNVTDKFTATIAGNYVVTDALGRNSTGYSDNLMTQFRQWWQTNVDVLEQRDIYEATGKNYSWNWHHPTDLAPIYWDNPYWTRYENYNTDGRNRVFGNVALSYEFADWVSATGRVSVDNYSELREERRAVGSVAGPFGINFPDVGSGYQRYDRDFNELNYDFMLNFNRDISSSISFAGILGTNIRRSTLDVTRQSTQGGLAAPGFYSILNSANPLANPVETFNKIGVDGVYASASFGYNNFLYLDLTGRQDRSSTLPEDNNTYFYPSASMSLVFSELMSSDVLSFGKLRLNYAQVGNDAAALQVYDIYTKLDNFGTVPLFSVNGTKRNNDLKPERTTSLEAGVELNFLNNRVGLDMAYYKTNTVDQILPVAVSRATGNSFKVVNAGEIQNQGVELAIFATPVKMDDFSWDINLNWTRNRNEVVELFEGVDNLQLQSFQGGVTLNATLGEPYGTLRGTGLTKDDDGNVVIDSRGFTTTVSDQVIGNVNPDWIGGINNAFTYKDLSLSFLIDIKQGGSIFSLDQHYGFGTGLYPETAGLNDQGNPSRDAVADGGGLLLDGVDEDGNPNSTYGRNDYYGGVYYWGRGNERYVYDASFVKLREVALTYNLPKSLYESFASNISLSLVGRNLHIFSKDTPYSDPEDGLGAGNVQGYQAGSYPAIKTYGIKLNVDL